MNGFELVEVDFDGQVARVAFYWDRQRACDAVVAYDALPTVVVTADAAAGDARIVLANGPFEFDLRALAYGVVVDTPPLLPGDLAGAPLGMLRWCCAEWWQSAIRTHRYR